MRAIVAWLWYELKLRVMVAIFLHVSLMVEMLGYEHAMESCMAVKEQLYSLLVSWFVIVYM